MQLLDSGVQTKRSIGFKNRTATPVRRPILRWRVARFLFALAMALWGVLLAGGPARANQDTLRALGAGAMFRVSAAPAVFVVNTPGDASDAALGDGVCDVDLATPGDQCTLRAAIEQANANAAKDTIKFSLPGPGPFIIEPLSPLPSVSQPAVLDATTQPGYSGVPLVQLKGSSAGSASGLVLTAGDSTVKGFVISGFAGDGVFIGPAGGSTVEGCYIGTNAAGSAALGNNGNGVEISGSGAAGNQLQGNYIGTDKDATVAVGNGGKGVLLSGVAGNTVGGVAAGARNVISGNLSNGVEVSGVGATGNQIAGNYIGLNGAGAAAIGNNGKGVAINGGSGNNVGLPGGGNVISGNVSNGVEITGTAATGNLVRANLIGTDAAGLAAVGNQGKGVFITGAGNNRIGGTNADERNLISGNAQTGLEVSGAAAVANIIQGNFIGLNAAGLAHCPMVRRAYTYSALAIPR